MPDLLSLDCQKYQTLLHITEKIRVKSTVLENVEKLYLLNCALKYYATVVGS